MKLLIVDDQEPVCAIVSRVAQQGGWNCIYKTDTRELDRTIAREKVDVLLIDYIIDGNPQASRTGLTIIQELRAKNATLPVILFTGWPDLVDPAEAEKSGVIAILSKPLSIQELRAQLNRARSLCEDEPRA